MVLTIGGVILLVLTGLIFFGLHMPKNIVPTIFALVLVTLAVYSVGALIAALARTERQAIAIANLVYFPVIFLSGATIPLVIFPPIMIKIVNIWPTR
ncbi:ABC transporter permease [Acidithrix ferrooxidans]|uniref:ABC transporter permease n=1 Tax=Acidithrix ferrooxidans TaxID=1280514 RepID=UPI001364B71D